MDWDDDTDFEFEDLEMLARSREAEDMLVCPWSLVIYNIDVSQSDSEKGIEIGMGKSELKRYFANFKPTEVHVFWGPKGHRGICVLQFGSDVSGLRDAQALEKSFLDNGHGRRDYETNSASKKLGNEFYGWIAREKDLKGESFGCQGNEIAMYLETFGNLMGAGRAYDQQVWQLAYTISSTNVYNVLLRTEMDILRSRADSTAVKMLQLKESGEAQDVESIRVKARKSKDEFDQMFLNAYEALEKKETELCQRAKEIKCQESSNLQSEAERAQLEIQIMEILQLQKMVSTHQDELKQNKADTETLVQKHEEEARRFYTRPHSYNDEIWFSKMQKDKMERHELRKTLQSEQRFHQLAAKESKGRENEIKDLKNQLADLEITQEFYRETINNLLKKERASNDELCNGRKMAAKIVQAASDTKPHIAAELLAKSYTTYRTEIGVKHAGSIDTTPWPHAFRSHMPRLMSCGKVGAVNSDDSMNELSMSSVSWWDNHIRNTNFQPFKTVDIGEDKYKQVVDHGNKHLCALRKELGNGVYNTVITALMEIEEYNPSGRSPVTMAWNFEKSRPATLKEVIAYLGEMIEAFKEVVEAFVASTTLMEKVKIEDNLENGTLSKRSRARRFFDRV